MKPKYSGKKSKKFWKIVNNSGKRQGELYSLGCVLQNLESFVLDRIKELKK